MSFELCECNVVFCSKIGLWKCELGFMRHLSLDQVLSPLSFSMVFEEESFFHLSLSQEVAKSVGVMRKHFMIRAHL
jgi:hypothetical protein